MFKPVRNQTFRVMSEFKYACPHCGQHIQCDSTQSGTTMECPTCFQKIIAPQAPATNDPKFILTGATMRKRRSFFNASDAGAGTAEAPAKSFPMAAVMAVILIGAAVAGGVFWRGKIFKTASGPKSSATETTAQKPATNLSAVLPPPVEDTNWMLDLAGANFPDVPAAGRINGKTFECQRTTLQGGTLNLRQGGRGPADLGISIYLHAIRSEDLAGQSIDIATNLATAPRVALRWRSEQQPVTQNFTTGYALRIEFGQRDGNRMPGKIYLVMPDEQKSYAAGNFTAEIQKPRPPRRKP